MSSSSSLILVLSTTSTREEAQRLATGVVQGRLAACVQISGPMTSVYRWKEAIETTQEYRLVIKSTEARWPELRDWLRREHAYEEPQIVRIDIRDSSPGYQSWVEQQVNPVLG